MPLWEQRSRFKNQDTSKILGKLFRCDLRYAVPFPNQMYHFLPFLSLPGAINPSSSPKSHGRGMLGTNASVSLAIPYTLGVTRKAWFERRLSAWSNGIVTREV